MKKNIRFCLKEAVFPFRTTAAQANGFSSFFEHYFLFTGAQALRGGSPFGFA